MRPLFKLAYIFAFSVISGFIDVVSLVRLGTFMGFMSGNIIHLGMCIADIHDLGLTKPAVVYLVPICVYFAAVLVGQALVTAFPRGGPWAVATLTPLLTAFPAVAYELGDGDDNFWAALPLCPGLGLQMVWTSKCLGVQTTMDTGNLQNLALLLAPTLQGHPVDLKRTSKLFPPLSGIVGLCAGSIAGGLLLVFGTTSLFVLLLPVACVQGGLLLLLTAQCLPAATSAAPAAAAPTKAPAPAPCAVPASDAAASFTSLPSQSLTPHFGTLTPKSESKSKSESESEFLTGTRRIGLPVVGQDTLQA